MALDKNKEQKLKEIILKNLVSGSASLVDGAIVTKLLSYAQDDESLQSISSLLSQEFPFLREFLESETESDKSNLEELVHSFVSDVIKDNPKLASEVSELASQPGITIEDILKKYPDFKKYLK